MRSTPGFVGLILTETVPDFPVLPDAFTPVPLTVTFLAFIGLPGTSVTVIRSRDCFPTASCLMLTLMLPQAAGGVRKPTSAPATAAGGGGETGGDGGVAGGPGGEESGGGGGGRS